MAAAESESDSSNSDPLDMRDEEGWEDMEPDIESEQVVCLFSPEVFSDVRTMLDHCRKSYDFDLTKIRRELELDFLQTIKLVNYIRSEVKQGHCPTTISDGALFDDDEYLKPVLEDDALLYSLDEVSGNDVDDSAGPSLDASNATAQVNELREELERLQAQFAEYQLQVQRSFLDDESAKLAADQKSAREAPEAAPVGKKSDEAEDDAGYFSSYSYNTIHEAMLKDTVRTDAYRDFIYDNKQVFKDKVVLDVGCGTGILSMFCAKAGAKMVIAVDNSGIIDKARQIVYENGLQDTVKCLRGKIEEVTLPVAKVDIIVSEWMGYCLLFEAMLDSVIWARDHYLTPEGLMVPSHANLRIAPLADPEFVASHVSFWRDVYGFKMTSMLSNVHDEVLIQSSEQKTIVADSAPLLQLDLHTVKTSELEFVQPFSVTLTEDVDALDGWVIWFDMFFMPSRQLPIPADARPPDLVKKGFVAFSTGPAAVQTHWQQGTMLIKYEEDDKKEMKSGAEIHGHVGYRKQADKSRLLDIDMDWKVEGMDQRQQKWSLN